MDSPDSADPKGSKHGSFEDIYTFLANEAPTYPANCDDKMKKANFRRQTKKFSLEDGKLLYLKNMKSGQHAGLKKLEVLRTEKQRLEVIKLIHEGSETSHEAAALSSHRGRDKMIEIISSRYFWYAIRSDVVEYLSTCDRCQKVNPCVLNSVPELHPVPVMPEVMKQIGVDLCTLPEVNGYKYLAVAICYFSKWSEAEPLKQKDAASVARFLYRMICRHGCFQVQINDQGRELVNGISAELHRLTGVKQRVTSAYHPQANGLVERQNRTIKTSLLKVLSEHIHEWPDIIDGVLFAHRTSVHKSTGFTPSFIVYNRSLVLPIDVNAINVDDASVSCSQNGGASVNEPFEASEPFDLTQFKSNLDKILGCRAAVHESCSANIKRAQKSQKDQYDKRHAAHTTFKCGDRVLLKNLRRSDRKGGWSAQPWLGPYTVGKMHDNKTCQLINDCGVTLKKSTHLINLKLYRDAKRPSGKTSQTVAFVCCVCCKEFKKQGGLIKHLTTHHVLSNVGVLALPLRGALTQAVAKAKPALPRQSDTTRLSVVSPLSSIDNAVATNCSQFECKNASGASSLSVQQIEATPKPRQLQCQQGLRGANDDTEKAMALYHDNRERFQAGVFHVNTAIVRKAPDASNLIQILLPDKRDLNMIVAEKGSDADMLLELTRKTNIRVNVAASRNNAIMNEAHVAAEMRKSCLNGAVADYIEAPFAVMCYIASAVDRQVHHAAADDDAKFCPVNVQWQQRRCLGLGLRIQKQHKPRQNGVSLLRKVPSNVVKIRGDGNCFYRAISYSVTGAEDSHVLLRNQVAAFMETPAMAPQIKEYTNVESYAETMKTRDLAVWATEVEMLACAAMLGTDIYSFCLSGDAWQWLCYSARFFGHSNEVEPVSVYLENTHQDHFDYVVNVASQNYASSA